MQAEIECLNEAGFATQERDSQSYEVIFGDQAEAYSAVLEKCKSDIDYGLAEAPLTSEEIRWLYDANVSAYECLLAEGYQPSEPVSFETYADHYRRMIPPWDPFLREGQQGPLPSAVCAVPDLYELP